jgi:AFG3 family protein
MSFAPEENGDLVTKKPYADATARLIDTRASALVERAYEAALALLTAKRSEVDRVARRLLEREVLGRDELRELLGARPFPERSSYEDIVGSGSGSSAHAPAPPPAPPGAEAAPAPAA